MSAPGLAARQGAADLLHGVLMHEKLLAEMTEGKDSPLAKLAPSEKARAQTLAATTLRNMEPLDVVLDQFLQKPPPLKVRIALRLAACEMLVDGIAPHAAVDGAVRLVRGARKTQHLAGLTNAVARRVADHGAEIWAEMEPQSLPDWLSAPLTKAYGAEAVQAIEAVQALPAPLDLTLKDPSTAADFAAQLGAEVLPTGSLRLTKTGQVSALPGFDDGAWWVQDAAAAVPATLLGDIAGKSVLDMCAAPGGKTMQLASRGANVTALDVSKERLKRVRENLERTGLKAEIIAADGLRWEPKEKFDAILLDAPCSATGTIRRHPDLPFAKSGDLGGLLRVQQLMLARALTWLNPGGKLVYCTCSLLRSEGEDQISKLLATRPEVSRVPVTDLPAEWLTEAGELRLRPDFWADKGGMDGFFAAILQLD